MAKPVLITGASSGIGYELARVCAAHQHDVILVARREDRLKDLKEKLEAAHGVQVWPYQADLTEATARQALLDWTQSLGLPLYALVNNAGFGHLQFFAETDWERQNAMVQLNIVALTHLTRLFLPGFIAQGQGRILNVASTAAFLPGPYMAVYYASKAYVMSFTEAIASELEGTGVTATTLCPGPTESEFPDQAQIGEMELFKGKLPSSAEVAVFGYEAMERGQRIAVHGITNQMLTLSTRLLPSKQLAAMMKKLQKPG
ncbi:MAG TPA: SDR family oxidoreductase [Leptolyngbyaceae cyanobacterium M65_K2018_010]|nr:SDR family oxidoreductase [Leptolyngbyaceae cyanobacterium M65_K2018_010]